MLNEIFSNYAFFISYVLVKLSNTYADSSHLSFQSKLITVFICKGKLNYCLHLPSQADLRAASFKLAFVDMKSMLFGGFWIYDEYEYIEKDVWTLSVLKWVLFTNEFVVFRNQ